MFEVDDEWFGTDDSPARADARAGRREIEEDLKDPDLQSPRNPATPAAPVFEVDDEWFTEDNKARAAKRIEQDELAKEMGIHEVEFPDDAASKDASAKASDSDFEYGIEDFKGEAPASPPVAQRLPWWRPP